MADGIRRFRAGDAAALAALTFVAIREIGPRAYSPAQVAAWAARHPGPVRLIASAAKDDTILVAVEEDDKAIADVLTESSGDIDQLYFHPDHTGNGVASVLLGVA